MTRPTFTPVYEETESAIKSRLIDSISDEWRKEPGDFIYDAVAPSSLEIKQLQVNQDDILKNAFAQYAEGEFLDLKLSEIGLTREAATPNKRQLSVTAAAGIVIPSGYNLNAVVLDSAGNPIEYTTDQATTFATAGTLTIDITCKTAGTVGNVATGSSFILQPSIPGISAIVDIGSSVIGTDTETDDAAYERYIYKLQNPETGGNKNDYVRWAEAVAGVGKAKCIPRWNGNGTVKVLLIGPDYLPASGAVVTAVQDVLDPGSTGLGDGKAPCGAQVTVAAATALNINITATASYYNGVAPADVLAAFRASVAAHLATMAFTGGDILIAKIGSLLIGTYGVSNYSGLTVNGGVIDIPVGATQVAVLGTVTL